MSKTIEMSPMSKEQIGYLSHVLANCLKQDILQINKDPRLSQFHNGEIFEIECGPFVLTRNEESEIFFRTQIKNSMEVFSRGRPYIVASEMSYRIQLPEK